MSKAQSTVVKEHGQLVRLANGKVAGCVEHGVFVKLVQGSRHMLRMPRAWAVDAEAYDHVRHSIRLIVVEDQESGIIYSATPGTFDAFRGLLDRGSGRQYYLVLDKWQTQGIDSGQLALWSA